MLTLQGLNEEVGGHLTSDLVSFTYDKRANLTKISTNEGIIGQYYYDVTNKMTYSVNKMGIKSSYVYDGNGRRVKQTIDAKNINVSETSRLHDQELLETLLANDNGIIVDPKKEINYIVDSTSMYVECV